MPTLFRLLAITAFLFNFSLLAADKDDHELERFGADYEMIGFKNLFRNDKKRVNAVLKPVLELIDLGRGGAGRIREAGLILEGLLRVHDSHAIDTEIRKVALNKLKAQAKDLIAGYQQAGKDLLVYAPNVLEEQINGLPLRDQVKEFLIAYLIDHPKRFELVCLNTSVALVVGVSAGCGCGIATYLSGKRYITVCPSLGVTRGFGIDVSIEGCKGDTQARYENLHRFHRAIGAGLVADIPSRNAIYTFESRNAAPNLGDSHLIRGVVGGFGDIEVFSRVFHAPVCPLPGRYLDFTREWLGLTYEDEPSQD